MNSITPSINNDSSQEEYYSDGEEHTDVSATLFKTPLFTFVWEKGCTISLYVENVRTVAPYLNIWSYNRKLNKEHKDKIKEALVDRHPYFLGSIQVVRDRSNNMRVINGQHRLKAIEEKIIVDIDMEFNMDIIFEVIDIPLEDMDNIEEDTSVIDELFKKANISLNMVPEDDKDIFCKKLVNAMVEDNLLKKGIKDKTTGSVYRPRIVKKDLYEAFKEYIPDDHLTIENCIKRIKEINNGISRMSDKDLFGRINPSESKLKQRERAIKIGFYLNIDSTMKPETWIKLLK